MTGEITKAQEIKRLTTPLKFKDSKAYDIDGNLINCVETLSDVRFIIEPKAGILTDDEILQYAPDSKAASRIRLNRASGDILDSLLVHESLPWYLGIYYVILIGISIPILFVRNSLAIILLILFIVPLIYVYIVLNLKRNNKGIFNKTKEKVHKTKEIESKTPVNDQKSIYSLNEYKMEVNNLNVAFEVKENVVRDLIAKRFEPPQLTYDKFMAKVDSCNKIFNSQADSCLNIISLAEEDTPIIRKELNDKINIMKRIINQIEDLINELVLNISSDSHSNDEVNILLEDMDDLIDSVKDYKSD